ncbi:thioredoxin family protein [Brevibacillus sp. SYP-B805]|uniref:thioredoxin family protein n=1 Tax=Brevibacillus sp. SYP-B805 TaxID=1578199 RepID=UPI0013EDE517|nr:thioredoxin family protein [Brevibacillus sp. SYP-B805]NGQ96245.1 thioredoxin family protein [Brevibacillus sp. SYP-B805]
MEDVSLTELDAWLADRRTFALLLYTPFCGTCKWAARMLAVVEAMLPQLSLVSINLNRAPVLAERWRITSVPCLLLFREGRPAERRYAMHSVEHLYRFLKALTQTNT